MRESPQLAELFGLRCVSSEHVTLEKPAWRNFAVETSQGTRSNCKAQRESGAQNRITLPCIGSRVITSIDHAAIMWTAVPFEMLERLRAQLVVQLQRARGSSRAK